MLAWLIATVAVAQPMTDAQIRGSLSQVAKKSLAADAVCVARPEVPEVFGSHITAAAIRDGACELTGIEVRGKLRTVEAGAQTAIIEAGWKALSKEERGEALKEWTRKVLTAFGQHQGEASVRVSRGKVVVTQRWLHRVGSGGHSALTNNTFTFDLDTGELLEQTSTPEKYWRTAFSTRPEKLEGNLTKESVSEALNTRGKVIKRCFRDHWEADLTYDGRVELEWSVSGGKAGNYGVYSQDPPPELMKCYVNQGISQIAWPEEMEGTVRWVFWARRSEAEAPEG